MVINTGGCRRIGFKGGRVRAAQCSVKRKIGLVANYCAAVSAYHSAIRELEQGMITGSSEIYIERRKVTEEARVLCEKARKELDDHEAKHGC